MFILMLFLKGTANKSSTKATPGSYNKVNYVTQEAYTVNVDEYAEFMRFKQGRTNQGYELNMVKLENIENDGPRAEVMVDGVQIDFLVDTGTPINIIDEKTFDKFKGSVNLDECKTKLYCYKASVPLPVTGEFYAKMESGKGSSSERIVVIKGQSECLLSYRAAVRLNIIKMVNKVKAMGYQELKAKFPKLFSDTMGLITGVEITLGVDPNIKPVKQKLRPIAFHLRALVEDEIKAQVKEGILERVDENSGPTEWISNLVIVPKSTGPEFKIRITSDSRAVNKAIKRTRFPGKTIEDVIYLVNGCMFFAKLDIRKAFHQLKLARRSRTLTTVITHIGLYRYKRLNMGMTSAAEIFAEVIRDILDKCPFCLNMADDILVFSIDEETHWEHLLIVLALLEARGIVLNGEKCEFCKEEVIFFGMVISKDGVAPTFDRCEALRNAKAPGNAKEVHSLLCLAQYSARFIQDFATIAAPLWNLTKKDVEWRWGLEEEEAFGRLKSSISGKAMSFFNIEWITVLTVDASPVGLGAVLSQVNPEDPKDKRIIAFASRLLADTEKRYSQCEKEALAPVWGCEKFWTYLFGKPFKLETDNRAIQLILSNPNSKPPARILRWALRLEEFDYEVVHKPGLANEADFFSRQPTGKVEVQHVQESNHSEVYVALVVQSAVPEAITLSEILNETKQETDLVKLSDVVRNGRQDDLPNSLSEYKKVFNELSCTQDGILLRDSRIIVPTSLRRRVVEFSHIGHQGIVKTKALIRSKVWFPGIDALVERMVNSCVPCQVAQAKVQFEPLCPTPMPDGPWVEISGDFYGPMDDGTYWYVNFCSYSRFFEVLHLRSLTAYVVVVKLEGLFTLLGIPKVYKTDNGPPFNSRVFSDFARRMGFTHRHITPLWPRANGEVECCMRNLTKVVQNAKLYGIDKKIELKNFLRMYRDTPHSVTKVAPSLLMFGRATSSGLPSIANNNHDWNQNHLLARENDQKAKHKMKEIYDERMKTKEPQLSIGSKVFMKQNRQRKSMTNWDPEPFVVKEIKHSMVTVVRNGKEVTRNSSFFTPVVDTWSDSEDDEAGVAVGSHDVSAEAYVDKEGGEVLAQPEVQQQPAVEIAGQVDERKTKRGRPTKEQSMAKKAADEHSASSGNEAGTRRSERIKAKSQLV